jgi:hypothetical protein
MGYDIHITRRKNWADKGNDITAEEWLEFVKNEPDLKLQPKNGPYFVEWNGPSTLEFAWFDWSDGEIYTKNLDAAITDKMVDIARHFDAVVQGDDGEIYDGGNQPPREPELPPPSFIERIKQWFSLVLWRIRPFKFENIELPFKVGDKVRDLWGNEHTVIEIDTQAEHGMGIIRTIRDSDGVKLGHSICAHGLTPIEKKNHPEKKIEDGEV